MTPKRRLGVCALTVFFQKKNSVVTNLWILFKQHILSHQAIIENNWPAPQNRDWNVLRFDPFYSDETLLKRNTEKHYDFFPFFHIMFRWRKSKSRSYQHKKLDGRPPRWSCLVIPLFFLRIFVHASSRERLGRF